MSGANVLVLPYGVLRGAAGDAFEDAMARELPDTTIAWRVGDRLDHLAAEIAETRPDVLVVGGTTQSLRAREVAPTLPIVAWGVASEVAGTRPANMTGVTLSPRIYDERLDLLAALVPRARRVALAYDAAYGPGRVAHERTATVARARGLTPETYAIGRPDEIATAMGRMAADRIDAVLVMNSPLLGRDDMAASALELRLPLFGYDWTTRAGGLASVTPDFREVARLLAELTARIARGAIADEIPIVEHETFRIAVNVRTADALGIAVPPATLASAAEVVR